MDCHDTSVVTPSNSCAQIHLIGNPNTGKTTLFNLLTGAKQKIANYPGVTVEKKSGSFKLPNGQMIELTDLPGTYSLTARSPEEKIAHDALLGKMPDMTKPDLILCILDATNLERNLYLLLQLKEFGLPVIAILNMMDEANKLGIEINYLKLSEVFQTPIIPISAAKAEGINFLLSQIQSNLKNPKEISKSFRPWSLEPAAEQIIQLFSKSLIAKKVFTAESCLAESLWLLSVCAYQTYEPIKLNTALLQLTETTLNELQHYYSDVVGKIIEQRYAWIHTQLPHFLKMGSRSAMALSDRIDHLLTHRYFGIIFFVFIFGLLFQIIFSGAEPLIKVLETCIAWLSQWTAQHLPHGIFKDFVQKAMIGGVGNVIVFIPQIALLFGFITLLEETGYIARAAFILDRVMAKVGLHGKAFIPLLSCFACAIPGIMATRTIESRKDRLITILMAPFMTCSARIPIYALIIAALFPASQKVAGIISVGALLFFLMYFLGLFTALLVAFIFKRSLLKGPAPAFILEMPPYRFPKIKNILIKMWLNVWVFLKQAGTIIFITSIVLWLLLTFPKPKQYSQNYAELIATSQTHEEKVRLQNLQASEELKNSYAGQLGHLIEPVIKPLGFDWKIGIGLIGSFAAREVIISTLGIIYGSGANVDEASPSLRQALLNETDPITGKRVFTPLTGLSLMLFYVFACQCMSTLAVIKKETGNWKWPIFQFIYMGLLAYGVSFAVFQIGSWFGY